MKVSEALRARNSVRAFLDTPVPKELLRTILTSASCSPSGGNLQPWHVWVVAGDELAQLKKLMADRLEAEAAKEEPEYRIYPPELDDPYRSRRYKNGEDLYRAIGIDRGDKLARLRQLSRNFQFFGAPVGLFFALDRKMEPGQWADLGMFMQSLMLVAQEHGLATCPQEAWSLWPRTVGTFLSLPPSLMLFCGMALGYADDAHPINAWRSDRADLSEFATFRGF